MYGSQAAVPAGEKALVLYSIPPGGREKSAVYAEGDRKAERADG